MVVGPATSPEAGGLRVDSAELLPTRTRRGWFFAHRVDHTVTRG
ncbi:hypothetical protein [Umezawaea sp.]